MGKKSPGAINKALDILEIFLKQENGIGISELADLTGLNISTAHRISSILVKRGYLTQQEKRGKYILGLKLLEFIGILKRTLKIRDISLPFLEKLRTISGESVNLAVLESNCAVYIEHIESNQILRTFTQVGNRVPLYCTGVGKVLLAHMSEKEREKYFLTTKSLFRYTDNTITDLNDLKKELLIVKREGVAMDNGEMEIGVRCIASPIRDSSGNAIAAISISGPYSRLNSTRMEELKTLIKRYGLENSRAIGYKDGVNPEVDTLG